LIKGHFHQRTELRLEETNFSKRQEKGGEGEAGFGKLRALETYRRKIRVSQKVELRHPVQHFAGAGRGTQCTGYSVTDSWELLQRGLALNNWGQRGKQTFGQSNATLVQKKRKRQERRRKKKKEKET